MDPALTTASPGAVPETGEERLKKAARLIRSLRGKQMTWRPAQEPRKHAPIPYDDTWGWWIQERTTALERKVNLILTLATTAVLGELIRIVLDLFGVIP